MFWGQSYSKWGNDLTFEPPRKVCFLFPSRVEVTGRCIISKLCHNSKKIIQRASVFWGLTPTQASLILKAFLLWCLLGIEQYGLLYMLIERGSSLSSGLFEGVLWGCSSTFSTSSFITKSPCSQSEWWPYTDVNWKEKSSDADSLQLCRLISVTVAFSLIIPVKEL